jgi:hypothetical protein
VNPVFGMASLTPIEGKPPRQRKRSSSSFFFALCAMVLLLLLLQVAYQRAHSPDFVSFNLILPVYYRVLVICISAVWFWAFNLHVLQLFGIHNGLLFKTNGNVVSSSATYKLAVMLSTLFVLSLGAYWTFLTNSLIKRLLPQATFVFFAVLAVLPAPVPYSTQRLPLFKYAWKPIQFKHAKWLPLGHSGKFAFLFRLKFQLSRR